MPKGANYEDIFADENGRVISCYLPASDVTICNIYSPCHSKPKEQLPFYKDLITYTDNNPNLICGGDANLILDPSLDRLGKSKYIPNLSDQLIKEWMSERDIIDL